MARKDPQINLRVPADLKDALDAAASANGRSLTAEVVFRLQSSFATKGSLRTKLEAIAAGTFTSEPRSLDVFKPDGFDPRELNLILREMKAELAALRHRLEERGDSSKPIGGKG